MVKGLKDDGVMQDYYIKYMMNPKDSASYWNTWVKQAATSPADKKLTGRIVKRPAVEFYDLQQDPYELNNLAGNQAYSSQVKAYTARLHEWMKQQGDRGAAMDVEAKK